MGTLDMLAYEALARETKEAWDAMQPERYRDYADSAWYDLLAPFAEAGEVFAWLADKATFLREMSVDSNSGGYIVRDMTWRAEGVAQDVCDLDPADLRDLARAAVGRDYPALAEAAVRAAAAYEHADAESCDGPVRYAHDNPRISRDPAVEEDGSALFVAAKDVAYDLIRRCLSCMDDAEEDAYNAEPDGDWLLPRADDYAGEYEGFDREAYLAACCRYWS